MPLVWQLGGGCTRRWTTLVGHLSFYSYTRSHLHYPRINLRRLQPPHQGMLSLTGLPYVKTSTPLYVEWHLSSSQYTTNIHTTPLDVTPYKRSSYTEILHTTPVRYATPQYFTPKFRHIQKVGPSSWIGVKFQRNTWSVKYLRGVILGTQPDLHSLHFSHCSHPQPLLKPEIKADRSAWLGPPGSHMTFSLVYVGVNYISMHNAEDYDEGFDTLTLSAKTT